MRRLGAAVTWSMALLALLALASAKAQQPTPPAQGPSVFRASVNLATISVVVDGPDGLPVHGLTSRDFTILDRGTQRPVAAFAEVTAERPAASPWPATLPLDVGDNASAVSERVVILVVDDLHIEPTQTTDVRSALERVLDGLGVGTWVGLVTTSGRLGMEPTPDRARVRSVVDQFDHMPGAIQNTTPSSIKGLPPFGGPASNLSEFYQDDATFSVNQDVAKMLSDEPNTRKAIVWVSPGLPMRCPQTAEQLLNLDNHGTPTGRPLPHQQGCQNMLKAMERANVSAYGINTRPGGGGFVRSVSEATGGFAIQMAAIDAGIDRILADLNNYYLLGFTPPDPSDTSHHEIEVRLDRPDLTLRYSGGYQATKTSTASPARASLALVSHVLPKPDLRLRLFAAPMAQGSDGECPVVIGLEVHGDAARFADVGATFADTLTYGVVALDLRRHKAVAGRSERRHIAWHAGDRTASAGDTAYQFETFLSLPPGLYQIRASGESRALAASGSVYQVVEIPEARKRAVVVGGLVVGYADGSHVPTVRAAEPKGDVQFLLTADRDFARADRIRVASDVMRPRQGNTIEVTLDIVDSADRVTHAERRILAPTDPPRVDFTIALDSFDPGAYRVRLTAVAGAVQATREAGFVVR